MCHDTQASSCPLGNRESGVFKDSRKVCRDGCKNYMVGKDWVKENRDIWSGGFGRWKVDDKKIGNIFIEH